MLSQELTGSFSLARHLVLGNPYLVSQTLGATTSPAWKIREGGDKTQIRDDDVMAGAPESTYMFLGYISLIIKMTSFLVF